MSPGDPARAHVDLPPLAVALTGVAEDFIVSEHIDPLPAPGSRYLWLRLRHRDLGTARLAEKVAVLLAIPIRDVGWSGRKDAAAIAEQWLCVPAAADERVDNLIGLAEVLARLPTDEPLTLSRHRSNRFSIRLPVDHSKSVSEAQLAAWAQRLTADGFPNYFGDQRFGDGSAVRTGEKLLAGDLKLKGPAARFALNAWQAARFNAALDLWLQAGRPLSDDDLVWHPQAGTALPRKAYPGGMPTGPMFGYKLPHPGSAIWQRELQALAAAKWDWAAFAERAKALQLAGERRPMWQKPIDLTLDLQRNGQNDAEVRFTVELPPGVYATTVIREFSGV